MPKRKPEARGPGRDNSKDIQLAQVKKEASETRQLTTDVGRMLGQSVTSLEYPGGRKRKSFRAVLKGGDSAIVSIRKKLNRAHTESAVLKALSSRGALVPELLAFDGGSMLIQQEIAGQRLSQAMHGGDEPAVEQLLNQALSSLAGCQQAGSASGFDNDLVVLGHSGPWIAGLLERPQIIGDILGVPAPALDIPVLQSLLSVRTPRFVKWDSRPGNAMVADDGSVYWFDWEHCGSRNRLDDMAWLLADEYVPDYPAAEERLITAHLGSFADELAEDEAQQYLSAYGVFHMAVRLGLICKNKGEGDWWDHEYCLQHDKAGVSRECMFRLCKRGERWAESTDYTRALAPWFVAVAKHFDVVERSPEECSL